MSSPIRSVESPAYHPLELATMSKSTCSTRNVSASSIRRPVSTSRSAKTAGRYLALLFRLELNQAFHLLGAEDGQHALLGPERRDVEFRREQTLGVQPPTNTLTALRRVLHETADKPRSRIFTTNWLRVGLVRSAGSVRVGWRRRSSLNISSYHSRVFGVTLRSQRRSSRNRVNWSASADIRQEVLSDQLLMTDFAKSFRWMEWSWRALQDSNLRPPGS